jgi:putative colanic acid biosynthesis acetyltransferase WcaF
MGDYVAIGDSVDLYNVDRIAIGSKVAISQRAFLCTASHDITSLARPLTYAPIEIREHAWIAAEAMIHPGAIVNAGAVVAARAVLRGSAPAWTIWAGNPAREVGKRRIVPERGSSAGSL